MEPIDNQKYIARLLDRFLQGNSTLEEEQILADYFRSAADLPAEWEDFRMKFAYFAGKVVAVEKSSPDIELRNLRSDAISSAWKEAGSFICDDERFNQIYTMIERTVEANMVSVHTDCPTIERFAWQEPNHLMAPSIFFMKEPSRFSLSTVK